MAYTPTEWEHGDTITAEKLNKLEEGVVNCSSGNDSSSSNVLILTEELHSSGDYYLLKKQDGTNFTEDDVNIDSVPTLELILIRRFEAGATFEYRWYHASHIDAEGLTFVCGENGLEYFVGKQGEWLRSTEIM